MLSVLSEGLLTRTSAEKHIVKLREQLAILVTPSCYKESMPQRSCGVCPSHIGRQTVLELEPRPPAPSSLCFPCLWHRFPPRSWISGEESRWYPRRNSSYCEGPVVQWLGTGSEAAGFMSQLCTRLVVWPGAGCWTSLCFQLIICSMKMTIIIFSQSCCEGRKK